MTSSVSTPAICYRAQTGQLVTAVATQSGEDPNDVYSRIYARLHLLYGIDVYGYPRAVGESLLVIAERHDLLDKVYALAYAEHLYQQQDQA